MISSDYTAYCIGFGFKCHFRQRKRQFLRTSHNLIIKRIHRCINCIYYCWAGKLLLRRSWASHSMSAVQYVLCHSSTFRFPAYTPSQNVANAYRHPIAICTQLKDKSVTKVTVKQNTIGYVDFLFSKWKKESMLSLAMLHIEVCAILGLISIKYYLDSNINFVKLH